MPPEPLPAVVALDQLDSLIQHVRGLNVMLDSDLAALYDVETRLLVRAVKRQAARFPQDFCFQLTVDELVGLRSQSGISITSRTAVLRESRRGAEVVETGGGVFDLLQ